MPFCRVPLLRKRGIGTNLIDEDQRVEFLDWGRSVMKTISVIVADDSEFMRESYQAILETAERLEVLGMAADGQEAVFLTDILKPQVAVLDIRMPKMDGITAAHQIVANHPNTGIVIISSYDDTSYINELLKTRPAGKAYLLKASLDDVQELIRTVEAVVAGWTVLDPVVVEKLISSQAVKPKSSLAPLSDQERSVLSMLVQGHTSTSISTALGGDASSVDDQVSGIYDKLSVPESSAHDRRVEAVLTFLDIARSPQGR